MTSLLRVYTRICIVMAKLKTASHSNVSPQNSLIFRSLLVGALAWLVSIFLYSRRLALFLLPSSGPTRRDDLLAQCVDPFTRTLDEPLLFYRILQPLIAHSLGWCGSRTDFMALLGSPGIAYLALVLSLSCVYWALVRRVSASLSLLTTFLIR